MIYTYIFKDKATGFYKIGKSNDVKRRFRELSTANINLVLVEVIPEDKEKFLHKLFHSKNVLREWFCLTEDDLKDCEELKFELLKERLNEY